jgi:hypothetical protein
VKSERKRIRKELAAIYRQANPIEGYDGMAARVNASYRRTGDIRLTMSETGLTFDVVWEMAGFKDEMDTQDCPPIETTN